MSASLKKMLNKDFYDISLSTFEKYYDEYKESRSSPMVYWAITKLGWNPFWYQTIMLDSVLKHDKIAWRIGRPAINIAGANVQCTRILAGCRRNSPTVCALRL